MLDVHSLKYEAHGKFGKRDRCLRVPQCVSGNSLWHAMCTHTSLAFAPGQMIVKYVKYNFSQFSIHKFIWFEEILTNLTLTLSQVRKTSFLGVISSYEPLLIKQSLYISMLWKSVLQPQRPQYYFYFKLTEAIIKIYMEHFCNIATSSFQMGLLQFKGMRDFLIN